MRIESLITSFEDGDVKAILDHYMPVEAPIEDVSAHFIDQGIIVRGRIPKFPAFEVTINLKSDGTNIFAEISSLKPKYIRFLHGTLVKTLVSKLGSKVSGVSRKGDHIQVDVQQLLEDKGIEMRIETLNITCSEGVLKLELTGTGGYQV
jgi:hypothetical protein